MTKRETFYKSKAWEQFVERLRIERATPDGLVLCEHCGEPILKKYDCIGHHVEELTEQNVDDVMIALNPENVVLVHFNCHNQIHKRFGYSERVVQNVFIVWGSPCAGKRTWVEKNAESGDLIVDMNRLWGAIRAGDIEKPNELKSNVFALRDCLLDMIKVRRGRWRNAYIIGGYPLIGERERLADLMGARLVFIDEPKNICMARAKAIGGNYEQYVDEWFQKYTPTPD